MRRQPSSGQRQALLNHAPPHLPSSFPPPCCCPLLPQTHFAWDACIGGTRYIQAPLCSPQERRKRLL